MLYHIVPPLPSSLLDAAFLGDARPTIRGLSASPRMDCLLAACRRRSDQPVCHPLADGDRTCWKCSFAQTGFMLAVDRSIAGIFG